MSIFDQTGALHPRRTAFDLSHERLFTCEAGGLYPCCLIDCVPGDTFKISQQILLRMQPQAAPLMETLTMFAYFHFVPYRLLEKEFEDFISGGKEGTYEGELDTFDPANYDEDCGKGTLWDYFGFPVNKLFKGVAGEEIVQFTSLEKEDRPLALPWKAYNMIYNTYFRDENLQDEVDLMNNKVLNRAWKKDYFTSALPWQQRGIAPSIPLTGEAHIALKNTLSEEQIAIWKEHEENRMVAGTMTVQSDTWGDEKSQQKINIRSNNGAPTQFISEGTANIKGQPYVDVSTIGTFDVSDLRLITQIQKWMERNARGGIRYTEFLGQHFGVAPSDARLDRPEYIGGLKAPIVVSEILQTSESGETPQGNMSGKGLGAGQDFIGTYHVEEFGLIMGIFNIMPRPKYQQGILRNWTKRTRFDYYFPEFQNLSEQAIHEREIFLTGDKVANEKVFGFQGRFDEYRIMQNSVHGDFRDILNYWHMGRIFKQAPNLNEDFIKCEPTKRNFLVQDEPPYLVQMVNQITAIRPLPYMAEPGLLDHN